MSSTTLEDSIGPEAFAAWGSPAQLLAELVSTPSLSRDEGRVAGALCDWLRARDLPAERWGDNVICVLEGDEPGPTLLLNSHLDTVSAREGWETDPWTPTLRDGRMYGLGSGDAKASVAAMAHAIWRCAEQGVERGRLVFAATVMEEVGGGGLEHILDDLGPIDAALVGEPTSLRGALAQGGLLILEACAQGRTSHAARGHLGVNALTAAARDLLALDEMHLEREHPLLGGSTAHATVIRGGERHNVIPDRCEYTIDIRYTPSYEAEELVALVDERVEAEIRVRSDRLRPVETSADAPIVSAMEAEHPDLGPFGSPTMSDWVHLRGVDAIKIGPGDSEHSHTPNESVDLDEVITAVDIYAACAQRFLARAPGPAPTLSGRGPRAVRGRTTRPGTTQNHRATEKGGTS